MSYPEPGFGALLIGDELLTGKRRDKHLPKLIDSLHVRGLELDWAITVGDDAQRLQKTLEWTLAGTDIVFSFGGIGATPDDRTRQCAAAAAGVELEFNAEGRAELEAIMGERAYPQRIHMVQWPIGAQMIPNPVNRVPGFSYARHHFVPGFPSMAGPMVEWVLDNHYRELHQAEPAAEFLLEALNTPESDLVEIMNMIMRQHPQVRLSCLPNAGGRRAIEFGLRGRAAAAAPAYELLVEELRKQGIEVLEIAPPRGWRDS